MVADASVLINFLRVDRTDLLARHSFDFLVTDHVAQEVSNSYPDQQRALATAINNGAISQASVKCPEELVLFSSLFASGRLGAGECSAIACAACRQYALAIDDNQAVKQARLTDSRLRILSTQELVVSMIQQGVIDIDGADKIKDAWAHQHRFRLKLKSFAELC